MYPLSSFKWFFQHKITKTIDFSRILWWFQTHLYKSICKFSARSSNPKISSEPKETFGVHQKDARMPMNAHTRLEEISKKNQKSTFDILFGNLITNKFQKEFFYLRNNYCKKIKITSFELLLEIWDRAVRYLSSAWITRIWYTNSHMHGIQWNFNITL